MIVAVLLDAAPYISALVRHDPILFGTEFARFIKLMTQVAC